MKTDQDIEIKKEDLEEVALQIQSSSMVLTEITQAIQEMGKEFYQLKVADVDDKEGLEAVHTARMVVKNTRVAVDHRRKELNEDALKVQRGNNAAAKFLTDLLAPIETHLETEEDRIEKIKADQRAEKLRIEQERIQKEADEKAAAKLKADEELLAQRRRELEKNEEDLRIQREEQEHQAKLQEQKDRELAEKQARLDQADKDRLVWEERIAKEQAELKEERRKLEEQKAADAVEKEILEVINKEEPEEYSNELTPSEQSLAGDLNEIGIELSASEVGNVPILTKADTGPSMVTMIRQQTELNEDKEKLTHRLKLVAEYADDHEPLITKKAAEIWQRASVEILTIVQRALGDTHKL